MGLFNILKPVLPCPQCKQMVEMTIQFKYGELWLHEFHLGEAIIWGKREKLITMGEPGHKRVVVDGAGDNCPNCGCEGSDYEIWIADNILVDVVPASGKYKFYTLEHPEPYFVVDS